MNFHSDFPLQKTLALHGSKMKVIIWLPVPRFNIKFWTSIINWAFKSSCLITELSGNWANKAPWAHVRHDSKLRQEHTTLRLWSGTLNWSCVPVIVIQLIPRVSIVDTSKIVGMGLMEIEANYIRTPQQKIFAKDVVSVIIPLVSKVRHLVGSKVAKELKELSSWQLDFTKLLYFIGSIKHCYVLSR